MQNGKFAEIFSTLSKVEQNRFKKWVNSDYHNQKEEVRQLLSYCLSTAVPKWRIEEAHKKVFKHNKQPLQRLRNTLSYLQKILENFLIYEQIERQSSQKQNILTSIYRERAVSKCFLASVRTGQQFLDKNPYRNIAFYRSKYELQEEKYLFIDNFKNNRLEERNIQEVMDSLDTYYLASKLKYSVHALSHQRVYNTHYQLHHIEDILQQVEEGEWLNVPTIAVYYYSYQTLVDSNNIQACQHLKTIFFQHWVLFDKAELKNFYLIALNFFIKKVNEGHSSFAQDALELYQSGLKHKIFLDQGYLSRFTYKNIVTSGIKCEQYQWVAQFIEEYAPYLPKQYQNTYVQYNKAKLYYQTQAYEQAIQQLKIIEPKDRELVIDSKVTLMKIYYKLDEYDALEALLESFHVYIKRNRELSDYWKKNYTSLIRYVRKLQHYNFYDNSARQALIEAIQQEPHLSERQWLLEQLA